MTSKLIYMDYVFMKLFVKLHKCAEHINDVTLVSYCLRDLYRIKCTDRHNYYYVQYIVISFLLNTI